MTKRQIYNTIVSLTAEIKATGVSEKLFEAARSEDGGKKVKEVRENFIAENKILYWKIMNFAFNINEIIEKSDTGKEVEVFGLKKNEEKGIWVFDIEVINASSFFVLNFLARINHTYLFETIENLVTGELIMFDDTVYLDALEEETGSPDLTSFLLSASFTEEELESLEYCNFRYYNTDDLLTDIFAGKLKEYVE